MRVGEGGAKTKGVKMASRKMAPFETVNFRQAIVNFVNSQPKVKEE